VTAFVDFVYPLMPVVELPEFLGTLYLHKYPGAVSLLLYQAVLFSAIPFLEMCHIKELGFVDRKSAHKDFFQRTRVRLHLLPVWVRVR